MAQSPHTFIGSFPKTAIEDAYLPGIITLHGTVGTIHALVEIEDSWLDPVVADAERRGWSYVGTGDQVPDVPTFTQTYSTAGTTIDAIGSFTAPTIVANYASGSASELNDLATKCATLEAEVIALRGEVVELKQNANAIVDILQSHGLAQ